MLPTEMHAGCRVEELERNLTIVGELYSALFANEVAGMIASGKMPYNSPTMVERGYLHSKGIRDDHLAVFCFSNVESDDVQELDTDLVEAHKDNDVLVLIISESSSKAYLRGKMIMEVSHDRATTFFPV